MCTAGCRRVGSSAAGSTLGISTYSSPQHTETGLQVAGNLVPLCFMVPLGLSAAASVRIGNLLGAAQPADAKTAATVISSTFTASSACELCTGGTLDELSTGYSGSVGAACVPVCCCCNIQVVV